MREFEIKPQLKKKLKKINSKGKLFSEIIKKKMQEILTCSDVNHYKNLRKPLQNYKRVHVRSSFVLIFRYENDKVIFCDIDHHDKIYK
tara:strand:- start:5 stop:268 length:264 start_codon:yes stop_codon:yes gene_type:complete